MGRTKGLNTDMGLTWSRYSLSCAQEFGINCLAQPDLRDTKQAIAVNAKAYCCIFFKSAMFALADTSVGSRNNIADPLRKKNDHMLTAHMKQLM
jgi:hypothetical protein